jgi:hypothetical protein
MHIAVQQRPATRITTTYFCKNDAISQQVADSNELSHMVTIWPAGLKPASLRDFCGLLSRLFTMLSTSFVCEFHFVLSANELQRFSQVNP